MAAYALRSATACAVPFPDCLRQIADKPIECLKKHVGAETYEECESKRRQCSKRWLGQLL